MFFDKWKKLFPTDQWVLNHVLGVRLCLDQEVQLPDRKEINFSTKEMETVETELSKLLKKDVIHVVSERDDQIVSNVFLRIKKDGSFRLILNLKEFNKCLDKIHFKMESLANAVNMMKQDCFFSSIDLKDAYFSVNIHPGDRKYFRFNFKGVLYEFKGLPQGFKDSPRIFTKIIKPVLGLLRMKDHSLVGYIDDFLIQGDDKKECALATSDTGKMFDDLGFTVHPEKSVFDPTQEIEFLGFVLNSVRMEVSISISKSTAICQSIDELISKSCVSIRQFAQVIGMLVALDQGVSIGPVFWRRLEIEKSRWLRKYKFNYDKMFTLSEIAIQDLLWWKGNMLKYPVKVLKQKPSVILKTDASLSGWGAVREGCSTGGCWMSSEIAHINVLELKAVLFGLKSLCSSEFGTTIQVFSDNSTTIACVNRKGSAKEECNDITRLIWLWCLERDITLIAIHLPGVQNVTADMESRKTRQTEWMLNKKIFERVNEMFGPFDIDLFASRVSKQLNSYMSWLPDPDALAINALDNLWDFKGMYAFPPFCLLSVVIRKVIQARISVTLIAPVWERQVWFPVLMKQLIKLPVLLPVMSDIVVDPLTGKGMRNLNVKLMACCISGNSSEVLEFRRNLETLSVQLGEGTLRDHTLLISSVGGSSVKRKGSMLWIQM